jgi:hypothetical protein
MWVRSPPLPLVSRVRGVAATCHLPTVVSWVQSPPDAMTIRAHDVAAACRLAMADAWVQLPLGALDLVSCELWIVNWNQNGWSTANVFPINN